MLFFKKENSQALNDSLNLSPTILACEERERDRQTDRRGRVESEREGEREKKEKKKKETGAA